MRNVRWFSYLECAPCLHLLRHQHTNPKKMSTADHPLSLSLSFSTLDYWITLCRVTMSQVFSSRFGCFRVWYSDTLGAGSDTWTPKRNEDRKNHVQLGRTSAPRIPFSRTYLDRTGPCTPQRPCTPLVFLIGLLAARGRVGGGIGGWRVDSLGLDVFFATG